ncbi:MAG: hypothetical protein H6774_00465 [Pseudomonadales bacterium]|nr:hypothetical protein [Candidatus Woesebacteria bacterium]MCB9801545.1 hypothetical protein [Pseudomonadales bacterium]
MVGIDTFFGRRHQSIQDVRAKEDPYYKSDRSESENVVRGSLKESIAESTSVRDIINLLQLAASSRPDMKLGRRDTSIQSVITYLEDYEKQPTDRKLAGITNDLGLRDKIEELLPPPSKDKRSWLRRFFVG